MPRSGPARASGSGSSRGSRFDAGCAAGHYSAVESNPWGSPISTRSRATSSASATCDATWSFLGAAAGAIGVGVTPARDSGGRLVDAGARPRASRRSSSTCSPAGASRGTRARRSRSPMATASSTRRAEATTRCTRWTTSTSSPSARAATTRAPRFPRLGASLVGIRYVETLDGSLDGLPIQFVREAELGPPELRRAEPAPVDDRQRRATSSADRDDAPAHRSARAGTSEGGRLGHDRAAARRGRPGDGVRRRSTATRWRRSCSSSSTATAALVLGDEEIPVRPGHVVSRAAGHGGRARVPRRRRRASPTSRTGPASPATRASTRDSNKINFGGVGVVARVEPLDYWDGED